MMLKMFSLLDTKAGFFHTPFFFAHVGQAVRACVDLGSDLSTQVGRHPADYALYFLGDWDDQTAAFHPANPENLGLVVSMLPQQATRQPELIAFPDPAASKRDAS